MISLVFVITVFLYEEINAKFDSREHFQTILFSPLLCTGTRQNSKEFADILKTRRFIISIEVKPLKPKSVCKTVRAREPQSPVGYLWRGKRGTYFSRVCP